MTGSASRSSTRTGRIAAGFTIAASGLAMFAVLTANAPRQGARADILITGGTVITMDSGRRIIEEIGRAHV